MTAELAGPVLYINLGENTRGREYWASPVKLDNRQGRRENALMKKKDLPLKEDHFHPMTHSLVSISSGHIYIADSVYPL